MSSSTPSPDDHSPAAAPGDPVPATAPLIDSAVAAPAPTSVAQDVFGDALRVVERFASMLADDGVRRGLIGPNETAKLWDRHLVNCAVLADAFPIGARVVDVGSGAGLPGIVLACARSDLRIDLVDSQARRTRFLDEVVRDLGLYDRVRVFTGRVEEGSVRAAIGPSSWVTARAVARLDRLAGWCLPLLRPGGTLVAMKGDSAEDEVAEARGSLYRLGVASVELVSYGVGVISPPPRAVLLVRR